MLRVVAFKCKIRSTALWDIQMLKCLIQFPCLLKKFKSWLVEISHRTTCVYLNKQCIGTNFKHLKDCHSVTAH